MKNKKTLIVLLNLFLFAGCGTVQIPNFKGHITLPASQDGYWMETVTGEEGRIPKAEWDKKKVRGIVILPEDWANLRFVLVKNCLSNKCKDAIGAFDDLFYTIDEALKQTGSLK